MKKSGFKYLFVIALAALTVQACAKKDNSLRARQTQTAEDKATADKLAAEKVAADKAKAEAEAKAAGKTPAEVEAAGKAAAEKAKAEAEAKASGKGVGKVADADQVYQDSCGEVPKLEVADLGEEKVTAEDLMRGGKTFKVEIGNYILRDMNYFSEETSQKGREKAVVNSLKTSSYQFLTPADMKADVTHDSKVVVVCHTNKKDSAAGIKRNFSMPNDINLETGAMSVVRTDEVKVEKGSITSLSTLKKQESNFKALDVAQDGLEVLIVAQEDNHFTIRKQLTIAEKVAAGISVKGKAYLSATYELKK